MNIKWQSQILTILLDKSSLGNTYKRTTFKSSNTLDKNKSHSFIITSQTSLIPQTDGIYKDIIECYFIQLPKCS